MINQKIIEEILKIEGKVRGVVFQTDVKYVERNEGEAGIRKLTQAVKQLGLPLSYGKKIKATGWYPLSWRVLSLCLIKDTFKYSDSQISEMGFAAPKYSFIVKTLLRYFISMEKTFRESAKYWQEHYTVGVLSAPVIEPGNGKLVIRLDNFDIHPIMCVYLKGYFKAITQLVVKSEQMTINETKCMLKGDLYHEFIIQWT